MIDLHQAGSKIDEIIDLKESDHWRQDMIHRSQCIDTRNLVTFHFC